MVIWKDIKGYEGKYQISNKGRVRSLDYKGTKKKKLLKASTNKEGYIQIRLYKNGKGKTYFVHRLVAEAFILNPNNYPVVNHKDENKSNNSVDNLEWCTVEYNNTYGTRLERMSKTRSKAIRQLSLEGDLIKVWESASEVARVLGYN